MSNTLLPCPFCGGEAKLKTARESDGQISYDSIYVACLNCRSTGLSYTTYYNVSSNPEEEAIAAWNRRAQPENKPLTLEELQEMFGEPVWISYEGEINLVELFGERRGYIWFWYFGNEAEEGLLTERYGKAWLAYRSKPKEE